MADSLIFSEKRNNPKYLEKKGGFLQLQLEAKYRFRPGASYAGLSPKQILSKDGQSYQESLVKEFPISFQEEAELSLFSADQVEKKLLDLAARYHFAAHLHFAKAAKVQLPDLGLFTSPWQKGSFKLTKLGVAKLRLLSLKLAQLPSLRVTKLSFDGQNYSLEGEVLGLVKEESSGSAD